MHPPPSPAWSNFTLMMECTPESSRCYSVYSVVWTTEGRPAKLLKTTFASLLFVIYFMIGTILAEIPCCIGEVKRVPRPRH